MSVIGYNRNEMATLHLVKTYCVYLLLCMVVKRNTSTGPVLCAVDQPQQVRTDATPALFRDVPAERQMHEFQLQEKLFRTRLHMRAFPRLSDYIHRRPGLSPLRCTYN